MRGNVLLCGGLGGMKGKDERIGSTVVDVSDKIYSVDETESNSKRRRSGLSWS